MTKPVAVSIFRAQVEVLKYNFPLKTIWASWRNGSFLCLGQEMYNMILELLSYQRGRDIPFLQPQPSLPHRQSVPELPVPEPLQGGSQHCGTCAHSIPHSHHLGPNCHLCTSRQALLYPFLHLLSVSPHPTRKRGGEELRSSSKKAVGLSFIIVSWCMHIAFFFLIFQIPQQLYEAVIVNQILQVTLGSEGWRNAHKVTHLAASTAEPGRLPGLFICL